MEAARLQIGEVARRTGLSVDAIRFYEKQGVVPRPARTESGYRRYQEGEVADLLFVRQAQQLGFSLSEIKELFAIEQRPGETCLHVQELIAEKLRLVRKKIDELQTLETSLSAALRRCRKTSASRRDSCPVLSEIGVARRRRS